MTLDLKNIDAEHICCALADKKCAPGVKLKKEWLKQRFGEGYKFIKLNVSGKVFIEYGPAEYAWSPVEAPGYTLINCFWVSGSFKGQGYGNRLFDACLHDSRDKNGIIVITSPKKRPFLADKSFFTKKGFVVCDTAPPYFELLVKQNNNAPLPKFRNSAKEMSGVDPTGLVVYYSDLCPFTDFYTEELRRVAAKYGIPIRTIKISSREDAWNLPSAFGIYCVFYQGKFLTHEILNESRFLKLFPGGLPVGHAVK
ncbi:MAG TPA: YoaP domain-containing protein [Bacillota bacterium]|nr:YoaP domain-containing protein [Bacillota bacterium]